MFVESTCLLRYKIFHRLPPCQVSFLRKCASLPSQNHYQILGINQRADNKEIRAAYIAKCKKYHPDTNPDDSQAQQKFIRLQEAYNVLSDPKERIHYDMHFYRIRMDTQKKTSSNEGVHHKEQQARHRPEDMYGQWSNYGRQQARHRPEDMYRQWSNYGRQQEETYGQWTGQRGKYEEWIKENKSRHNSNQEHSEYYNEAFYQQKYYDMFGPFGCLVDSFFGNKESKQASFQDIFLLFTLINIFTILGYASGIYLIKDITESARKWQQQVKK
ncbi:dnaJ homolog subfamily B member 9-like [Saccostrea echinata]|uniref:dnaJ homolog subfamily B member 9-like n=1 Tax=Saccostrea echinata TaxID=191078 RepID=UPI002A81DBCB|nr:dnaJ homolog subfamily B member 9-like [Saccostrea echinata]